MNSIMLFPVALAVAIVMGGAEMLPVAIFVAVLFLALSWNPRAALTAGVLTFAAEAALMAAFITSR
jgi:hypothetical protein